MGAGGGRSKSPPRPGSSALLASLSLSLLPGHLAASGGCCAGAAAHGPCAGKQGSGLGPHPPPGRHLQTGFQMAPNGWEPCLCLLWVVLPSSFRPFLPDCALLSLALFLAVFFSLPSVLSPPSTSTPSVQSPSGPWLLGPTEQGDRPPVPCVVSWCPPPSSPQTGSQLSRNPCLSTPQLSLGPSQPSVA